MSKWRAYAIVLILLLPSPAWWIVAVVFLGAVSMITARLSEGGIAYRH